MTPSSEQTPKKGAVNNKCWVGFYALSPWDSALSTPHQALQQLQIFEVFEKTSFAEFLSELCIAVMNVKDIALVPPDDSTMQVCGEG